MSRLSNCTINNHASINHNHNSVIRRLEEYVNIFTNHFSQIRISQSSHVIWSSCRVVQYLRMARQSQVAEIFQSVPYDPRTSSDATEVMSPIYQSRRINFRCFVSSSSG